MKAGHAGWKELPVWILTGLVLFLLYLPLIPPLMFSLTGDAGWTTRWYGDLARTPLILGSVRATLLLGAIVALLAPLLGLLAAMAVREFPYPRLVLLLMLLPLFIPGVSMGLSTAFLFRMLALPPSLPAMIIVQLLWALPFATLIIVTVMSTFDTHYLEAARMCGANRWQAFRDVELPLILPGVLGAATFSFIISVNETVRTSIVQGPWNTIQTYIWSTYKQVGLSPVLYALMGLMISITVAVSIVFLIAARRQEQR
jgi:ABC-type spermidine/putrescine transport system permease subunit II